MAPRRGNFVKICVGWSVSMSLMLCVNAACITTDFFLSGHRPTQAVTATNIACERWDALSELTVDLDFGNESVSEAGNACRDPDQSGLLWCFGVPASENVECYVGSSTAYTGKQHETENKHLCQRWSDNTPNSHNYQSEDFPDASIADAENYCRDPDSLGTPWCFTLTEEKRWDTCSVGECKPLKDQVTKMDCGIDFCPPVSTRCPRGWLRSPDGEVCYTISGSKVTWEQSIGNCENFGGKQLEFEDEDEFFFLKNVLLKNEKDTFWLGLSDMETEGTFLWHSTGKQLSFSAWQPTQPDNFFNSEHCVSMSLSENGYLWRDDICDRNYNYICETAASEVEATTQTSTSTSTTITTTQATTTVQTAGYDKCRVNTVVNLTAIVFYLSFCVVF